MWYFTWTLGVGFAVLLAVLNGMWNEAQEDRITIENGKAGNKNPQPLKHKESSL
jgi:cytochrome bd-I ubiquinol oxidase subunit X